MSKLADETDGLAKAVERLEHDIRDQNTPNWPSKRTTVNTPDLHTILSALRRVEKLEAALRVAEHDLVTTDNLRATDLNGDQLNEALGRGAPLSDLEWMTDNSRGLAAIRQALTCEA